MARITIGTYVDLDVLLDTRMTIYRDLNPEAALTALTDGSYHKRMHDRLVGIDHDAFMAAWKDRNENILHCRSTMTNAVLLIKHLSEQWIDEAIRTGLPKLFKIIVNTYPYQLTEAEVYSITQVLGLYWPAPIVVEAIHMSREELTPVYCKEHFETMFMYDYYTWLEPHAKAFEKTRLPEVTLMAPAMWFGEIPTEEDLALAMKDGPHPMKFTQLAASPMIRLELIDAKYFCMVGNLYDNPA